MDDARSDDGVSRSEFSTTDSELAENFLREVYCENKMHLARENDRFTLHHRLLGAHDFAINDLHIGIDHITDADPGLEDTLLVVQPNVGRIAYVDTDYPDVYMTGGDVVLVPPTGGIRAICERYEVAIIRLSRSGVADYAAAMSGIDVDDLTFNRLTPLTPGLGRYFIHTVAHVRENVLAEPWAGTHPVLLDQAFQSLAATLLATFPNTALAHALDSEIRSVHGHVAESILREVVDYIDTHADQPLGPTEIAEFAGMPANEIIDGLRRSRGRHPAESLWQARLRGVRRDLTDTDPESGTTIAELAARWGFSRGGRFRIAYTYAFGERPEDTLRR